MDFATLRSICLRLPRVTEEVKAGNEHWFLTMDKPFCIVDGKKQNQVSFPLPRHASQRIQDLKLPSSPHQDFSTWVYVEEYLLLSDEEWEDCMRNAIRLALSS